MLAEDWGGADPERAFVMRALAGALSRVASVEVLVPGPPAAAAADGLFDLYPVGQSPAGGWPDPTDARWPRADEVAAVVFGASDDGARRLAAHHATRAARLVVWDGGPLLAGETALVVDHPAPDDPSNAAPAHDVGLFVPVNPLAAQRRHTALGDVGYVLVLTDRPGTAVPAVPPEAVAWLSAGFPGETVVAVEGGRAAVWRARSLHGTFAVDTRTDLWRLMAHAATTVDLDPGRLLGRECVESMRFGTPTVVPDEAPVHATVGRELRFSDPEGLLEAVAVVLDRDRRASHAHAGRQLADTRYGDAPAFLRRVHAALGDACRAAGRHGLA